MNRFVIKQQARFMMMTAAAAVLAVIGNASVSPAYQCVYSMTSSYIPRLSLSSPSQLVTFLFSCTSALPQNPAMPTSVSQPLLTQSLWPPVCQLADLQAILFWCQCFFFNLQM